MGATFRRVMNSRPALKIVYGVWIAFPYPIRRPLTSLGILLVLLVRRAARADRWTEPTTEAELGNLSFWGVPEIDLGGYRVTMEGLVEQPAVLTFEEISAMAAVERKVIMDCVGGFRNVSTMKGVPIASLLELVGPQREARSIVFHCADGYFSTHPIKDLRDRGAFLAYEINGKREARFGFPLRLAAPHRYGYKWAKWVTRLEFVAGFPKGYWARRGLPNRGDVGDIW
ncbi:MAG: molybdopterin-dependent oxidoreductase [Dehalococcoidia bacterium]